MVAAPLFFLYAPYGIGAEMASKQKERDWTENSALQLGLQISLEQISSAEGRE
jgi:hypothetical protein